MNDTHTHDDREQDSTISGRLLRRQFVGALGALGLAGLFGERASASEGRRPGRGNGSGGDDGGASRTVVRRLQEEFRTRVGYSQAQLKQDADRSAHASNDRLSESRVVAKFGKSLPHEDSTGLPTAAAYASLVEACETGEGFEAIPQASLNDAGVQPSELVDGRPQPKPLVQPETAWSYNTAGGSTAQLRIAAPPAFDSPQAGAEMVELYWRALTRDVNFRDYDDDPDVAAAVKELDGLDGYRGPGADGSVTPGNVFRGVTPGSERGPYVSQFLWKDRELGGGTEDQKIEPQAATSTPADYMTTVRDWLKIQKGVVPPVDASLPGNEYSGDRRYIVTGRDMCERVHDDPPFRQIQKAAQVLVFSMNAPLDEGIPYTLKPFTKPSASRRELDNFTAQTTLPFNDFGPLYIEKAAIGATEIGQKAAWHKKWNVHRRLRPEEYGGRVQAVKGGTDRNGDELAVADSYPIPANLLDSEALARSHDQFGSFLLPQAYAEGSPTHPSFPAGHSVVAGAGATVLKALFDGDYSFPAEQKVVPTRDGSDLRTARETGAMGVSEELTVRGELNKLASNMALGRNRAGIHYRSDGIEGLRLGEAAAVRYLEDLLTLPDRAGDVELSLTTFDGEQLRIEPSA